MINQHLEWQAFESFTLFSIAGECLAESLTPIHSNSAACELSLPPNCLLKVGTNVRLVCTSKIHNTEITLIAKVVKTSESSAFFVYLQSSGQRRLPLPISPPGNKHYVFPELATKPTVWGAHPWFISHKIIGTLVAVSKDSVQIRLNSDPRNVFLPDMVLELIINYPTLENYEARFKVVDVQVDEETSMVELEVMTNTKRAPSMFGKYVVLSDLQMNREVFDAAGLVLPKLRWSARIDLVSNQKEMDACLALRKSAYTEKQTSRFKGIESADFFRDRFDNHAVIISLKVGRRLIGTGRIIFNNSEKQNSEIAQLTSLPEKYWQEGFIEASRFATCDDYRGQDAFLMMLYTTFKLSYLAGIRYLLIDCEDHLLPAYKRLGAKDLKITFVHPLEGVKLNLIEFDHQRTILGQGITFLTWFFTVTPLLYHLVQLGALQLGPMRMVLVKLGNFLGTRYQNLTARRRR